VHFHRGDRSTSKAACEQARRLLAARTQGAVDAQAVHEATAAAPIPTPLGPHVDNGCPILTRVDGQASRHTRRLVTPIPLAAVSLYWPQRAWLGTFCDAESQHPRSTCYQGGCFVHPATWLADSIPGGPTDHLWATSNECRPHRPLQKCQAGRAAPPARDVASCTTKLTFSLHNPPCSHLLESLG